MLDQHLRVAISPPLGNRAHTEVPRMGSINAMDRTGMSPARIRLLDTAKRRRFGLKELSQQLGRNPSYLRQYLVKGSPRVLPADVVERLAELLEVGPEMLRDDDVAPGMPGRPPGRAVPAAAPAGPPGWPPLPSLSPHAVTMTLTQAHGMVQPRDRVVCEPQQTPRLGDLAAVVVDGEVRQVGLLAPGEANRRSVIQDGPAQPVAEDAQVWRVVAILAG